MSDDSTQHEPATTEPAANQPVDATCHSGVTVRLSWLSALLASLLAFEIVGLTFYALHVVKREMEPERLAERAEQALVENYTDMRKELIQQVRHQAPVVAQHLSNRLLQETPKARMELEEFTVRHLEEGFDNAFELSADEFRHWLRTNHDSIEDAFEQIEQAPEDARLLVMDTEASLEEQLGVDLRDQAKLTLELYRALNEKLERLTHPSTDLSQQERLERRMIRLLRALVQ